MCQPKSFQECLTLIMSLRPPVITNLGNLEPVSNNFKERKFAKRQNPKVKNELKTFNQLLKTKKDEFKKNSRKKFSKKDAKERMIKDRSHLNRRSAALIIRRKKK